MCKVKLTVNTCFKDVFVPKTNQMQILFKKFQNVEFRGCKFLGSVLRILLIGRHFESSRNLWSVTIDAKIG